MFKFLLFELKIGWKKLLMIFLTLICLNSSLYFVSSMAFSININSFMETDNLYLNLTFETNEHFASILNFSKNNNLNTVFFDISGSRDYSLEKNGNKLNLSENPYYLISYSDNSYEYVLDSDYSTHVFKSGITHRDKLIYFLEAFVVNNTYFNDKSSTNAFGENDIIINQFYLNYLNAKIGDNVTLINDTRSFTLNVSGIQNELNPILNFEPSIYLNADFLQTNYLFDHFSTKVLINDLNKYDKICKFFTELLGKNVSIKEYDQALTLFLSVRGTLIFLGISFAILISFIIFRLIKYIIDARKVSFCRYIILGMDNKFIILGYSILLSVMYLLSSVVAYLIFIGEKHIVNNIFVSYFSESLTNKYDFIVPLFLLVFIVILIGFSLIMMFNRNKNVMEKLLRAK